MSADALVPAETLTLLDGTAQPRITEAVLAAIGELGMSGPRHDLTAEVFAPCQGCFECWTDHPGTCKANDAANAVMRDVIGAELVLWTTRIRFGCWGPTAKAALDKSIGLLSPFFATVAHETHHRRRYRRYPRWGVLAVVPPGTSDDERELFRQLVARNAVNVHSDRHVVVFVEDTASVDELRIAVRDALRQLRDGPSLPFPAQAPFAPRERAHGVAVDPMRPRHAVLWVGSAKPHGTSSSESLGRALLERLAARGWTTEVAHAAKLVRLRRSHASDLVDTLARADLIVLATPVYVDAVPALVLAGLARLADATLGPRRPALLSIVQCGFPELTHTVLALEVLSTAARRIGLPWAGHLALGGGGVIGGRALDGLGGRVFHQTAALDSAAAELDAGDPVSPATSERFATTFVGPGMYRVLGDLGWVALAIQHGSLTKLWQRPFDDAAG